MSAFVGTAEKQQVVARLTQLGVDVFVDGVPDEAELPRTPSGKYSPFVVVAFGQPIPRFSESTLDSRQKSLPHVLPITVGCFAGMVGAASDLCDEVMDLLVDWQPTENSNSIDSTQGISRSGEMMNMAPSPSLRSAYRYFSLVINNTLV